MKSFKEKFGNVVVWLVIESKGLSFTYHPKPPIDATSVLEINKRFIPWVQSCIDKTSNDDSHVGRIIPPRNI